jgi:hypothetical protein
LKQDNRRLHIGLLGCGPISQAAHLDAIRKARNADLYAISDIAEDLTARLAAIYQPEAVYNNFAAMLADPHVEAVESDMGGVPPSGAASLIRTLSPTLGKTVKESGCSIGRE